MIRPSKIELYNPEILEHFEEYLRDNFDATVIFDYEFTADEILYKLDKRTYKLKLEEYIQDNYENADKFGYELEE